MEFKVKLSGQEDFKQVTSSEDYSFGPDYATYKYEGVHHVFTRNGQPELLIMAEGNEEIGNTCEVGKEYDIKL